ncbi:hypothetical protein [Aromatoleum evansii]|uniref:hypothetical protein n=1 Tax=Aromatoleum evansii TaxID=59406 RepID=UPI00145E4187|nr:hypothetical protein [Aromatoleum evansii]NMG27812.1 hypothetical protein [Aromatoleum evansii]
MSANTLKAIAVTAELTGTELSTVALKAMDVDLSAYPEADVLHALDRCRKELKGRLTLSAVLDRVAELDGRPGAEEAWATALSADDEAATVVWTDEIVQALAVAKPLLDARDKVAARMAFCQAYERLVRKARDAKEPCRWWASLGRDPRQRAVALAAAVETGQLTHAAVQTLLPAPTESDAVVAALIAGDDAKLLSHVPKNGRDTAMHNLRCLRAHLAERETRAAAREAQRATDERGRQAAVEARKASIFRAVQERMNGTASTVDRPPPKTLLVP